ncbi:MAG TPA: hypothetical protein VIJ23_13785 [Mycobacterium sp.]
MPTDTTQQFTTPDLRVTNNVSAQQVSNSTPILFSRPPAGRFNGGNAMNMSIEDLARDRIRQIRTDCEAARQVNRARAVRKARKAATRS